MTLTINDVEKVAFSGGLFGYRKREVEEFKQLVVETLRKQVEEITSLRKEINHLQEQIDRYKASEDLVKESVILAQKNRDETIANARKEAENIIKSAELKVLEVSRELGALKAERERFEFEFYGLLRGFLDRLDALRSKEGFEKPTSAEKAQSSPPLEVMRDDVETKPRQEEVENKAGQAPDKVGGSIIFPEEFPR